MENCVYRFLNINNEIIYIGKAKHLRQRLATHSHLPSECYEECVRIEYVSFETEQDMDYAEKYFIPKFKPKYNVALGEREITFDIPDLDDANWVVFKQEIKRMDDDTFSKNVLGLNSGVEIMETLFYADCERESRRGTGLYLMQEVVEDFKKIENKFYYIPSYALTDVAIMLTANKCTEVEESKIFSEFKEMLKREKRDNIKRKQVNIKLNPEAVRLIDEIVYHFHFLNRSEVVNLCMYSLSQSAKDSFLKKGINID